MSVFFRLSSFIHRHRTHSYQFAKITKFFKSTAKKVPLATQPARIFRKPSPNSANTVPPATRAVAFSQTSSNPLANTVPPATRVVAFYQTSSNPSANTVPPATRVPARTGVFLFFRTSSNSGVDCAVFFTIFGGLGIIAIL